MFVRKHSKTEALNQTTILRERPERLNRHSVPHQLRIIGSERFISYPICEGQSAISPQNTKSFNQRSLHISNVAKCFLTDDSIDARVRERNVHHVALDDASGILKANTSGQHLCTCN